MPDPLMVKRVDQNAASGVVDRIHYLKGIIERFDFCDGHVLEAGPHASPLCMHAQVLIKVLGDLAVGL